MPLFRKKKEKYPAEEFTLPEPPDLVEPMLEQPDLPKLPDLPHLERGEERIKQEFEFPEEMTPMLEPRIPPKLPAARKRFTGIEKPIFVKIEKFKDSIEDLSEIKEKLRSASLFLQKIKEIRHREDQELTEWEKDLENLKAKLENIDRKLFSDVE